MCYMIAVALPPEVASGFLLGLPQGMRSWPGVYPELSAKMNAWEPVIVGTAQCSCDLFIPQPEGETESLRRKYEKRDWSQAKIERALADRKPSGFPGSLPPDLRRWLSESVAEAGEAYLMVHWAGTPPNVADAVRLTVAEFANPNCRIDAEQLYHIVAEETVWASASCC